MSNVVEFFVQKNVINHLDASYVDYWRLARVKDGSKCFESRYNKYICLWIPIVWPRSSGENFLSIAKFIERVTHLQISGEGGFFEYSDEMNVAFTSSGAQFSCVIDSWEELSEGLFSLVDVIILVKAWHRFLQMPDSENSKMEVSLS